MKLKEREIAILNLVKEGYTSTEIGSKLFMSKFTVESAKLRILRKLNCRNMVQAVTKCFELRILLLN